MASKEQKLMPTTEGALNIKLNINQMLDEYLVKNITYQYIQHIKMLLK